MKTARFRNYLDFKASQKNTPIKQKSDVKKSKDEHIDQDFPGFPNGSSKENIINPVSKKEKKVAAIDVKDGEKKLRSSAKKSGKQDESYSDGSGGAFGGTEEVKE